MKAHPMTGVQLTEANFECEVLRASTPVLVDFWAPWCPPCRMLKPELERLASDLAGQAVVGFVNVDEQPGLATLFKIVGVPTVLVFNSGRLVDAWTGVATRASVLERLKPLLHR